MERIDFKSRFGFGTLISTKIYRDIFRVVGGCDVGVVVGDGGDGTVSLSITSSHNN